MSRKPKEPKEPKEPTQSLKMPKEFADEMRKLAQAQSQVQQLMQTKVGTAKQLRDIPETWGYDLDKGEFRPQPKK